MVMLDLHHSEMANHSLSLFGERPPSATSNRPFLGTNSNHQPMSDPAAPDWNIHKPSHKYTDRLFGQERKQDSFRSNTSFNVKQRNYTQQRCPTPKNKGKSSYVDETLFGSARSANQFDDVDSWDDVKTEHKPIIKEPSTSKKVRPGTPGSSRPSSVYGKRGYYKTTSHGSFVDDTLFGKVDNSPSKQASDAEYDYFGNKIISKTASKRNSLSSRPVSRNQTATPDFGIQGSGFSSSRPPSAASSRPPSAMDSERKVPFESWIQQSKSEHQKILPSKYQVFNASYVDESLFGPKPVDADFPAPWDKEKKTKPFIFDTSNYSTGMANKTNNAAVMREKGPYLRKPIVKNPNTKPAWK